MKKLVFLLCLMVIVILAGYLVYREGSLPVNKSDKSTVIFVINKGESLSQIAKNLEKGDLIRNKLVFYIIVKKMSIDKKIQAGDFRLSPAMSAEDIASDLTHGTLDVWTTIIEGMRKEEVAQVIGENLKIPEIEFIKTASEGYLFPDTYLIPKQATSGSIVKIMMNNFETKYDESIVSKANSLGLTKKEVVILASLVEREGRTENERQKVASILLKRLKNDWPLQIDATVQYAIGYQPKLKTWWKPELSEDDLKFDSPYNTYKYPDLPPEPICNPGLASIKAVVEADPNTPYFFYFTDRSGKTHYSKTLEEHNENIRKSM